MNPRHDDNPVEALMRHNIEVHNSKQVLFLHNLMFVLLLGFGVVCLVGGIAVLAMDMGVGLGLPMLPLGVFLIFWAPYSRKMIREDTARKTAAARYQLEQVKAWRRANGL